MPNDNHDAAGRFSSGQDSGQHGTGTTHTGNAGVSATHRSDSEKLQNLIEAGYPQAKAESMLAIAKANANRWPR